MTKFSFKKNKTETPLFILEFFFPGLLWQETNASINDRL